MMDENRVEHASASVGHEERDVNVARIVVAAAGLLVAVVFTFVLVRWTFTYYLGRAATRSPAASPLTSSYGRQVPPEPRLQTQPIEDLRALRRSEDALLNSYGWADREGGTVRIPIARAMELLAQRGLPVAPQRGERP